MFKWMRIAVIVIFLGVAAVFFGVKVTGRLNADSRPPVITADTDELTVSVSATDEDLLAGMKAEDNRDGDVTDTLVVVSKSKFIKTGTLNVNYAAFDTHNNVATYSRRVTYSDYSSPEFVLDMPLIFGMNERNVDYLADIQAIDALDGDISSLIRTSTGVMVTNEDGSVSMPLTLQVTNSSADTAQLELTVEYLDNSLYQQARPSLSTYIVYTDRGVEVDAASYIDGILNGSSRSVFEVTNYTAANVAVDDRDVDYDTPGVYQIHYSLHQAQVPEGDPTGETAGQQLGTTQLYVVVKEDS